MAFSGAFCGLVRGLRNWLWVHTSVRSPQRNATPPINVNFAAGSHFPCRILRNIKTLALAGEVQRLEQQQAWLRETFSDVFDEVRRRKTAKVDDGGVKQRHERRSQSSGRSCRKAVDNVVESFCILGVLSRPVVIYCASHPGRFSGTVCKFCRFCLTRVHAAYRAHSPNFPSSTSPSSPVTIVSHSP